jgi:choline dehydrogenase-like flavoprotein
LHNESSPAHEDTVVVVGSGPAAAAATVLLTKAGVDVTLLEAGLERTAFGLTARVAGFTVARVHRTLTARSTDLTITGDPQTVLFEDVAPGGLTNHWSCAVPRFSPDDFLDARRAGEAFTWPVDYGDLAPWYDWVEPLLCISGSQIDVPQLPAGKVRDVRSLGPTWNGVERAAQRDGQGVVPVPYAYGGGTTLTLSGTVFNAFVRLVKPARRSGHLTIRYGAHVTQLEWSGAGKRVAAVIIRDAGTGATHRVRCRAVVLAAGAINSTKILMQSVSRDFPEGLGNTHGVLGRYLHDHPLGKVEIEIDSPLAFHPAACITRQPLDRTKPLYAAACLQWSGVGFQVRSILAGHPGRLPSCGFNVFGTMAPSTDNLVALNPSRTSADGTPGLTLNVHHPPEAAETLVATRDRLITLLDEAKLRPRVRMWMIDRVGGAVHYAGTCRMHASPQYGMLDRWSRLHSVRNVVVADSAAFTTGPEKNPALTAMALSARASQHLVEDLRAGNI